MNAHSDSIDIAIIGSGFAGLCMAIKLKEAGFSDFFIAEQAETLGGTWRDNHYPGCACDVQSHVYSFSFAPNPHWTPELLINLWQYSQNPTKHNPYQGCLSTAFF